MHQAQLRAANAPGLRHSIFIVASRHGGRREDRVFGAAFVVRSQLADSHAARPKSIVFMRGLFRNLGGSIALVAGNFGGEVTVLSPVHLLWRRHLLKLSRRPDGISYQQ